jgi:hypothetical protein
MDTAMISQFRAKPVATRQSEILESLVFTTLRQINAQFPAFCQRLIDALLAQSQQTVDAKQANFCFYASNLLKSNAAGLTREMQQTLESALRHETDALEHGFKHEMAKNEGSLTLVPFEEMDHKVKLGTMARPFEQKYADQLTALNIRLAFLLERDSISTSRNPFRPDVMIGALNTAWQQFDANLENHELILPFFQPDTLFDMGLVLQAVNETLMTRGVLPGSVEAYRIIKTESRHDGVHAVESLPHAGHAAHAPVAANVSVPAAPHIPVQVQQQLHQQLQQWLETDHQAAHSHAAAGFAPDSGQLKRFLGELQQKIAASSATRIAPAGASSGASGTGKPHNVIYLQKIKQMAPKGSLSPVDENAIDLLTKIFETVLGDSAVPQEVKHLVGLLQVPVLNEALQDKNFFFAEDHPARRLLELLTQLSLGWEQAPDQHDPLFAAMARNVVRLQKHSTEQKGLFADVVKELEQHQQEEQQATEQAIALPIAQALKQEKTLVASKTAKTDVAMRVGTGEVVAFVETFLEDKWVSVLTIAYTVQEEKPEALKSAIKTMDDLIWSVKPKITQEQRKDFIAKLPPLLANLNKWLNLIKWNDADRLQFFAELAETHASIVRAPLELSPERQMEIALEIAKKAAERRLEKQRLAEVKAAQENPIDESVTTVDNLARGRWLEFSEGEHAVDGPKKYKLAWISPMRSLYIFSSNGKKESFSMSAEQLADLFRQQQVKVLRVGPAEGSVVANALSLAIQA